jgi:hypothetical protein
MKLPLPPDVEFHEDICLIVWRPRGLLNRAAVNKLISVIGELEFALKKPFNRFLDTVAADAVDLDSDYIRRVSLYSPASLRQSPGHKDGYSRDRF